MKINVPLEPVGYWILPGSVEGSTVCFGMAKSPTLIQKLFMRMLGWKWKSYDKRN